MASPAIYKAWRKTIVFAAKFIPARDKYAARILLEIAPLNEAGGDTHSFYWDAHRCHAVLSRFLDGNFKGWETSDRDGGQSYIYGSRLAGNEYAQTEVERRSMSLIAKPGQLMVVIRRGAASASEMESRAITLDYWEAITFAFATVKMLDVWGREWGKDIYTASARRDSTPPAPPETPPPDITKPAKDPLAIARVGYEGYISFAQSKGVEVTPEELEIPAGNDIGILRSRASSLRDQAVRYLLEHGQIDTMEEGIEVANAFVREYIASSLQD